PETEARNRRRQDNYTWGAPVGKLQRQFRGNSVDFLKALTKGLPLLMDGAMGTELIRAGAGSEKEIALSNLTRPQQVQAIHAHYRQAGAQVFLTNTFQANLFSLL